MINMGQALAEAAKNNPEMGLSMESLAKLLFREFPDPQAPVTPPPFANVIEFMRAVQKGCKCGHSLEAHGKDTGRCQYQATVFSDIARDAPSGPKCACPKFEIELKFTDTPIKFMPSEGDPAATGKPIPPPPPTPERARRARDEEEV